MVQAYNFLASWQLFRRKGSTNWVRDRRAGSKIESVPDSKELTIYHNWVTLENKAYSSKYSLLADGALNDFSDHELANKIGVASGWHQFYHSFL